MRKERARARALRLLLSLSFLSARKRKGRKKRKRKKGEGESAAVGYKRLSETACLSSIHSLHLCRKEEKKRKKEGGRKARKETESLLWPGPSRSPFGKRKGKKKKKKKGIQEKEEGKRGLARFGDFLHGSWL